MNADHRTTEFFWRTNERIETKSRTLHPLPLTDVKETGLRYYKIMTVKLWKTHKVAWKLDKQAVMNKAEYFVEYPISFCQVHV